MHAFARRCVAEAARSRKPPSLSRCVTLVSIETLQSAPAVRLSERGASSRATAAAAPTSTDMALVDLKASGFRILFERGDCVGMTA